MGIVGWWAVMSGHCWGVGSDEWALLGVGSDEWALLGVGSDEWALLGGGQ